MARLIDVEPFDVISIQATGDTAYDQGFEDGVRFVAEKLDASPTIDAIPVEWLEAHKMECIDDWGVVPISIGKALILWQKEQEVSGT